MKNLLKQLWLQFARSPTHNVPQKPVSASSTGNEYLGYPSSFQRRTPANVHQPEIFDPALKQFGRAFRAGDPEFADVQQGTHWRLERRRVMEHLLKQVCASSCSEKLVLRGSMVMSAWFGDQARDPGDLDWVVIPASITAVEARANQLLEAVIELAHKRPNVGQIEIDCGKIATDDIWTYDRVPGRRVVFPWSAEGLPTGVVQMDFVFGEMLPVPPVITKIPMSDGGHVTVNCASRELSLAWKLMWLANDMYPQGKDLYDAVLLAESVKISDHLLEQVLPTSKWPNKAITRAQCPRYWNVDWENFTREYPWIDGSEQFWKQRLEKALAASG